MHTDHTLEDDWRKHAVDAGKKSQEADLNPIRSKKARAFLRLVSALPRMFRQEIGARYCLDTSISPQAANKKEMLSSC